jgi:hypothetical protein
VSTNRRCTLCVDKQDGPNGVFAYGAAGAFPNDTFGYSNYWVDVVFSTSASDTTPPTVSSTSPVANAIGCERRQQHHADVR